MLELQHATGTLELGWEGQGRVFQIERAAATFWLMAARQPDHPGSRIQ
jgi:hypothetical protein